MLHRHSAAYWDCYYKMPSARGGRRSITEYFTICFVEPTTTSGHYGSEAVEYTKAMKLVGRVTQTLMSALNLNGPFAVPCGAIMIECM